MNFRLNLGRYDTTTVNVHHSKDKNTSNFLSFGHSKDNRPDLLQFKPGLGVLDPAGIPIFTETTETVAGKRVSLINILHIVWPLINQLNQLLEKNKRKLSNS